MNIALPTRVIVLPSDLSVDDIPRRPYDFNQGDRRFHDREEAIDWANEEAIATGVRRIVRADSPALLGGDPLYLVQAVGGVGSA